MISMKIIPIEMAVNISLVFGLNFILNIKFYYLEPINMFFIKSLTSSDFFIIIK